MRWGAIDICEIAATPTANANLLAKHGSVIQHQYFFTELTSNAGAK
jgi:hypothetical protein